MEKGWERWRLLFVNWNCGRRWNWQSLVSEVVRSRGEKSTMGKTIGISHHHHHYHHLDKIPYFFNLIFHLLLQCKNLHRGFACVRYTCRSRYICYHFIFIQILWQRTGGLDLKAGNQMKPFAKEPSCNFNNDIIIVIAAVRCCFQHYDIDDCDGFFKKHPSFYQRDLAIRWTEKMYIYPQLYNVHAMQNWYIGLLVESSPNAENFYFLWSLENFQMKTEEWIE